MLMYTSGTTGTPKGALLVARQPRSRRAAVSAAHEFTPSDRVLSSLPLYHVNGQCIATISPLVSGGSIVMPHRFSVSQWWPLVERYRPTWINVVPTIIAYLLNGPDLTPAQAAACRDVRFARSASAPLPPEHHRAFEARFGISVLEGDGSHRVRFGRVREPARSRRAQDRLAGTSARNGGASRRAGRRGAAATASAARSSCAATT